MPASNSITDKKFAAVICVWIDSDDGCLEYKTIGTFFTKDEAEEYLKNSDEAKKAMYNNFNKVVSLASLKFEDDCWINETGGIVVRESDL